MEEDTLMEPNKKPSLAMAPIFYCFVALLLTVASPLVVLFFQVQKGIHDMKFAKEEFKRTVNPDELCAWVFSQLKKHSEGGYLTKAEVEADWPKTLPRFAESHRFHISIHPPHTSFVWDFSGGCGLMVTVLLDSDGAPIDTDDREPWAKGIRFEFLSR